MRPEHRSRQRQHGVTLIELVVGMVALAFALVLMATLILPQARHSVEPVMQSRAAALGQALLDEILGRAFDECSGHDGVTLASDCRANPQGSFRCDEGGVACIAAIPACPATGFTSATEEVSGGAAVRGLFNDVDDYHCLSQSGDAIEDALGNTLDGIYEGFAVQVRVAYAGADLGVDARLLKRVTVTVTPPSGSVLVFTGYKGNY